MSPNSTSTLGPSPNVGISRSHTTGSWGGWVSNPRPGDYESLALTTELPPRTGHVSDAVASPGQSSPANSPSRRSPSGVWPPAGQERGHRGARRRLGQRGGERIAFGQQVLDHPGARPGRCWPWRRRRRGAGTRRCGGRADRRASEGPRRGSVRLTHPHASAVAASTSSHPRITSKARAPTDQARQPHRAAATGDDSERHLGLVEHRVGRCKAHVAAQRHLAAATTDPPLDHRDRRLRHRPQPLAHPVKQVELGRRRHRRVGREPKDRLDVEVGDEPLGLAERSTTTRTSSSSASRSTSSASSRYTGTVIRLIGGWSMTTVATPASTLVVRNPIRRPYAPENSDEASEEASSSLLRGRGSNPRPID